MGETHTRKGSRSGSIDTFRCIYRVYVDKKLREEGRKGQVERKRDITCNNVKKHMKDYTK